jgi:thiamine pyrophosphate-dependent acetolactate synthase large subunit-like protein
MDKRHSPGPPRRLQRQHPGHGETPKCAWAGYEDFGVDVPRVNFAKIAEAVGIRGFRVESSSDLKDAFWSALRHKVPLLWVCQRIPMP